MLKRVNIYSVNQHTGYSVVKFWSVSRKVLKGRWYLRKTRRTRKTNFKMSHMSYGGGGLAVGRGFIWFGVSTNGRQ